MRATQPRLKRATILASHPVIPRQVTTKEKQLVGTLYPCYLRRPSPIIKNPCQVETTDPQVVEAILERTALDSDKSSIISLELILLLDGLRWGPLFQITQNQYFCLLRREKNALLLTKHESRRTLKGPGLDVKGILRNVGKSGNGSFLTTTPRIAMSVEMIHPRIPPAPQQTYPVLLAAAAAAAAMDLLLLRHLHCHSLPFL
jgi:hypothetical protein